MDRIFAFFRENGSFVRSSLLSLWCASTWIQKNVFHWYFRAGHSHLSAKLQRSPTEIRIYSEERSWLCSLEKEMCMVQLRERERVEREERAGNNVLSVVVSCCRLRRRRRQSRSRCSVLGLPCTRARPRIGSWPCMLWEISLVLVPPPPPLSRAKVSRLACPPNPMGLRLYLIEAEWSNRDKKGRERERNKPFRPPSETE